MLFVSAMVTSRNQSRLDMEVDEMETQLDNRNESSIYIGVPSHGGELQCRKTPSLGASSPPRTPRHEAGQPGRSRVDGMAVGSMASRSCDLVMVRRMQRTGMESGTVDDASYGISIERPPSRSPRQHTISK